MLTTIDTWSPKGITSRFMVVVSSSTASVLCALVAYANPAHARSALRGLRITFHALLAADFTGGKALSSVIEGAIDHIDALVVFAAKASNPLPKLRPFACLPITLVQKTHMVARSLHFFGLLPTFVTWRAGNFGP
ncbi:hypothetical protein K523DRAFT_326023 [Schizophyllum commune Tattone D]|nr:hypothetical protein K523DRAFT_326023 [Schizophyllum commune Tattone D]